MREGVGKDATYVWADDRGHDGSWNDDAPNSETGEDQETPGTVQGISLQASKSTNAWNFRVSHFDPAEDWHQGATLTRCHDNRADDHQLPVIASEGTEQEEHEHSSTQNTKSYG